MTSTYAENYPRESPSINLFIRFRSEKNIQDFLSRDSNIPEILSYSHIMEECDGLINLKKFIICMTSDCKTRFNYVPSSKYKILDEEYQLIWKSFKESISALRHQNHELNVLYTDQR